MSTQFGDGKRTLSTGDLVISVSEIFDRLQTKVDPNTLEQLLRDILAGRRNQVRPGELITAELINQILAELESLQVRLTKLEAGVVVTPGPVPTPVEITDIIPHGIRRVGEEIGVVGKNFLKPGPANNVTMGGTPVLQFKSTSDDKLLVFNIPQPLTTIDADGSPVKVVVQNPNGTASRDVQVQPAQDFPSGTLILKYTTAPVLPLDKPNVTAAGILDFIFLLTAKVNKAANYDVAGTISPSTWKAQVLNVDNDQVLSKLSLPANLNPGEKRQIRMRVTAPATGGAAPATVELSVTENSGGNKVTPGNERIENITIGLPPPKPETRATINFRTSVFNITQEANRLRFARNKLGMGTFDLTATEAGTYIVTAALRNSTGWNLGQPTAANPFQIKLGSGTAGPQDFPVALTPDDTATNTDLVFTVERTSADGKEPFTTTYFQPISAG